MKLYDSSLLVYVTGATWTARRLDKTASKKLTADASAVDSAARVNKHLLADSDALLRDITAILQRARRLVDEHTLPWDDAGNRICSNAGAIKLVAAFEDTRSQFAAAVGRFVEAYPVLREHALIALGDLADPEEYPAPDALRQKFRLRLSLSPVADTMAGAVRRDITAEQTALLEQHYTARVQQQQERALSAAWERLHADAAALAARLGTDAAGKRLVLRDSAVEGLRATSVTLNTLNVFGSAELDKYCRDVQSMLHGLTAQNLRDDDRLAEQVREKADALAESLAGLI